MQLLIRKRPKKCKERWHVLNSTMGGRCHGRTYHECIMTKSARARVHLCRCGSVKKV